MLNSIEEDSLNKEMAFTKIKVQSRIEPYASYVTYEISIQTNEPCFTFEESAVRRRYSDFRTLHSLLSKQFPYIKLPTLPPKAPFKKTFDLKFVERRKEALEDFLAKLLSQKICLSSQALHLFLQTSQTMVEIKEIVNDEKVGGGENILLKKSTVDLKKDDISVEEEAQVNGNLPNSNHCELSGSLPDSKLKSLANGGKRVSFCDQVTVAEVHVA